MIAETRQASVANAGEQRSRCRRNGARPPRQLSLPSTVGTGRGGDSTPLPASGASSLLLGTEYLIYRDEHNFALNTSATCTPEVGPRPPPHLDQRQALHCWLTGSLEPESPGAPGQVLLHSSM